MKAGAPLLLCDSPRNAGRQCDTIEVNHVVLGDLLLCEISASNEVPKGLPKSTKESMNRKGARKVDDELHEFMKQEISRGTKLEIVERDADTIGSVSSDSTDDLSVESEKSSTAGD